MRRSLFASALLLTAAAFCNETPMLVVNSGGHEAPVRALVFSPDGKFLYSAGDDKVVRVWDTASGAVVRTIRGYIREGQEGKIYAIALSPYNRFLAVGGYSKSTLAEATSGSTISAIAPRMSSYLPVTLKS